MCDTPHGGCAPPDRPHQEGSRQFRRPFRLLAQNVPLEKARCTSQPIFAASDLYQSIAGVVPADRNAPFRKVFTVSRPVGGDVPPIERGRDPNVPLGTKPILLYTPCTAWTFSVSAELARGSLTGALYTASPTD